MNNGLYIYCGDAPRGYKPPPGAVIIADLMEPFYRAAYSDARAEREFQDWLGTLAELKRKGTVIAFLGKRTAPLGRRHFLPRALAAATRVITPQVISARRSSWVRKFVTLAKGRMRGEYRGKRRPLSFGLLPAYQGTL